jgi:nucleolar protein 16
MGGSRAATRRHKTTHTKVKVGLRKQRKAAPHPVPVVLPGVATATGWDEDVTPSANYKRLGLSASLQADKGRSHGVRAAAAAAAAAASAPPDAPQPLGRLATAGDPESLRLATGRRLARGARPPRPLTARQRRLVGALVAAHGDDVAAMARDTKLNPLQHTGSALRVLVDAFAAGAPTVRLKG